MARKRAAVRRSSNSPGLYLFASVAVDRVTVLQASRIERVHHEHLRTPVLVEGLLEEQWDGTAAELVLAVLAPDGTVLDAFGWPATAYTCVEVDDDLESAEELPDRDARWRIPAPHSARYLQFYRTDLVLGHDGRPALTRTSLGLYDLKPRGRRTRRPRLPAPTRARAIPLVLRALGRQRRPTPRGHVPLRRRLPEGVTDGGYIKGASTLLHNGAPSKQFNIVVLADGFTEDDQGIFDRYANLVTRMLRTKAPYSRLIDRFNVYKVSVVSTESGISNCPRRGTMKSTYFQTTGCWHGTTAPGFVGTELKSRILDAVDTAIPQRYAHCVATIVNCPTFGGSTPPELGMAFLTMPQDADDDDPAGTFMDMTAHEFGHVIGHLAEEYNPCNRRNRARVYPNEATEAAVNAGTVWWQELARPGELDRNGRLLAIHRAGDDMDEDCQPILVPHARERMLGAFFGCHNGDGTPPPRQHTLCDPRGRHFYRAMADCRMRHIDVEFCRACAEILTRSIRALSS